MSLLLLIGNAAVDRMVAVEHYPQEGEEIPMLAQLNALGSHAANSARILVQYQHSVHYRDLLELQRADFSAVTFSHYDWIHVEGRNIPVLATLLPTLQARFDQVLSLAVTRPQPGIEALIVGVDIVFFSRDYAKSQGFDTALALLAFWHQQHPRHLLTCTWGTEGAYAVGADGRVLYQPTKISTVVIETHGADDTFNAGMIHALATGKTLQEALTLAVNLMGRKVGQQGLSNLCQA